MTVVSSPFSTAVRKDFTEIFTSCPTRTGFGLGSEEVGRGTRALAEFLEVPAISARAPGRSMDHCRDGRDPEEL